MPYTADQIQQISEMYEEWREREAALTRHLFRHPFRSDRAKEMMQHGLSRRLADLRHGVDRIFEILPPSADAPSQRDLRDTTAFLQAFVINAFGAIDNLAWIWASEEDARDARGRPLRRGQIGFTPDHALLRGTVSEATRAYLGATDEWFDYLESYRHALAHRIPLYIPPKTFDENDGAEFRRLEEDLMARGWPPERWIEVQNAQRQLGTFDPVMMHSYGEQARPVRFHAQIVCDFATVVEIAEHVVRDLEAHLAVN